MDESVRIYEPKFVRELKWAQPEEEQVMHEEPVAEPASATRRSHLRKQPKNSKWKFFFDEKLWKKILDEKEAEIRRLDQKHPWVQKQHNWALNGKEQLMCHGEVCLLPVARISR